MVFSRELKGFSFKLWKDDIKSFIMTVHEMWKNCILCVCADDGSVTPVQDEQEDVRPESRQSDVSDVSYPRAVSVFNSAPMFIYYIPYNICLILLVELTTHDLHPHNVLKLF